jgi:AhpD family alkylhydroperoxidase
MMSTTDLGSTGGGAAVASPRDALAALVAVEAAARLAADAEVVGLLAAVCAAQHGLAPVVAAEVPDPLAVDWRSRPELGEDRRVALTFAEKFVIDVSTIDDDDRAALGARHGAATGEVVFLIYALDLVPRVRTALARLVPGVVLPPVPDGSGPDGAVPELWGAIDHYLRTVAQLDALDAVTTELVRLRGARQHQCRMCASLRNRTAMLEGADEALFDAVDRYVDGSLSPRHTAALALVDAMIWTPGRLDDELVAEVSAHFDEAERLELVLDVMRNAANKIAVSLAADAANVDEGFEIYDIGPDGEPVYGLTLA